MTSASRLHVYIHIYEHIHPCICVHEYIHTCMLVYSIYTHLVKIISSLCPLRLRFINYKMAEMKDKLSSVCQYVEIEQNFISQIYF